MTIDVRNRFAIAVCLAGIAAPLWASNVTLPGGGRVALEFNASQVPHPGAYTGPETSAASGLAP